MSWDTITENSGYWIEVATARMARRALHANAKSLSKMAEDEAIQEWIAFMPEKSLTKSLRKDVEMILAKTAYEKAAKVKQTTSKEDKNEKTYPDETEE